MYFCPLCSNILLIEKMQGRNNLKCRTCTFYYPLYETISNTKHISSKKQAEIILQQIDMQKTDAQCPNCNHDKAYYEQMQTRSADEQSTIKFICIECNHVWIIDR